MTSIYFAHPINVYNTPLENRLLSEIPRFFPNHRIENPNHPTHQANYQKWRKERGNGMLYYFEDVLPGIDEVIALPFSDNLFGKGVAGEIQFFLERSKPAWEITHTGLIFPLTSLPEAKILTIEETKQRIYINGEFSKGIKPYE